MRKLAVLPVLLCLLVTLLALAHGPGAALAADESAATGQIDPYSWTATYSGFTPYGQIKDILDQTVATSDRVRYEVMGRSAGGHDLYLVIVARPDVLARLDERSAFRDLMLSDPAKAQQELQDGFDVKAPVFINCSIHGDEPNGVDAGLRLIERLAYDNDAETRAILDNCIVLLNICQNPDGRIADTRTNANGFDMNRDFLTASQPEVRATTAQIVRWLPMLFLDLHGYYNPMRIEPCTPPHNPNYEYDLFIKWALPDTLAMADAVKAHTNHRVLIPYLDLQQGFDDYSPIYTPQFAMYYGAAGMTLETFAENDAGTDGHFWACWAGMLYAARHKNAMLFDQIERFRRGVVGYRQPDITFPYAYVIPATQPLQKSPLQAARMVDQLLFAGIEVDQARAAFVAGARLYPAGTYVVPMRQPLRALANTWLWNGQDVSYMTNGMYSVCATSLPQLLGFDRATADRAFAAPLTRIAAPTWPKGAVTGPGTTFTLANDSNNAVKAVNELMAGGAGVAITTAPSSSSTLPAGTFFVRNTPTTTLMGVAQKYHLTFTPCKTTPATTKALHPAKLAVAGGSDLRFVMRQLGFPFTAIKATSSLAGYDVVVNANTSLSASTVKSYVSGGGAYVGLGSGGVSGPLGNMLPVTVNVTNAYDNNALVHAAFKTDGLVGAYFKPDDYAFVYGPLWFTGLGSGVTIDASYGSRPDWYVCGYWRDRAGAQGKPTVVSGAYGAGRVVYIGFAPMFRAYPESTYRLVANAIWHAMK